MKISAIDPAPIRSDVGIGIAADAMSAKPEAATTDQLHIAPLDLKGALQILIAEVRSELALPGDVPPGDADGPQTLVQLFLQAVHSDDTQEPAAWLAVVARVEAAMPLALDKAVAAVTGWRDVASGVVAGARDTRAAVIAALADDPPNPLWLRPEWLALAPRMERFRRRRQQARRRLLDPDLERPEAIEYVAAAPVER